MTQRPQQTLEQLEQAIDYYMDAAKLERNIIRDGLGSKEASENRVEMFESEARRLLQISVNRRAAK